MTLYKSIGVTATRIGLRPAQESWLDRYLELNSAYVLHHGDCIGGDSEVAHKFAKYGTYIIAHPGIVSKSLRAFCKVNDYVIAPEETLVRNKIIVNSSDVILAFPATSFDIAHSGTWQTIRYAIKQKVDLRVISPEGTEL